MSLVLHDYELSADAYKARLLLALTGRPWQRVAVDVYPGFEHRSDAFLALNPRGTMPVLVDDGLVVTGIEAILVHLAETHATDAWLPVAAAPRAASVGWLAFSGQELAAAEAARLEAMLGLPAPWPDAAARARHAFRLLDDHLTRQGFTGAGFLTGERPTIADVACFPAAVLAIDFGEALADYPRLRAWTRRMRALPGFVGMPGIPEFL